MDSEYQAQYIALKTLKQRCEYLQQRLETVEEENYRLKLESKGSSKSPKSSEKSSLEKQLVLLNHQNKQLSQQIQMITNENQTLWSQLSKLMPGNESLGNKLSMSTHNAKFGNFGHSINLDASSNVLDDCSKESLEEISLKLINGILMGKTELENQYSQMIDLQKDSNLGNVRKCLGKMQDNRSAINSMKGYMEKLKDFKEILNQQKSDLSHAISSLKNHKHFPGQSGVNNGSLSKEEGMKFLSNIKSEECKSTVDGVNKEENVISSMVCPMCGKGFNGKFTDFYAHVSDHFEDDSEEYVDANATFEIVP